MKNIERAQQVIAELAKVGVREFCICAGARNAPFVEILAQAKDFKVWRGFEERSMAFFALGRAKRLQAPVAIITTSGTAVAETLPAVIEAQASQVPLIVVSADRPRNFRYSGSPQTMPQLEVLRSFVEQVIDLEKEDVCQLQSWSRTQPLHVNICFGEPLLDEKAPAHAEPVEACCHPEAKAESRLNTGFFANAQNDKQVIQDDIKQFLSLSKKPLVLVGELLPEERAAVLKFLLTFNAPVYAEALSGLRGAAKLEALELRSSDKILSRAGFDGVLRIGGVPTTSFWRQLEEKFAQIPILNMTRAGNTGIARKSQHVQGALQEVLKISSPQDVVSVNADYREIFLRDQAQFEVLRQLLQKFPKSEPGMLFQLQQQIMPQDLVYLGNSLPIREWDLVSEMATKQIFANRGMNGIDGQLSTFFGVAEKTETAWGIFGDLTTLYDLSAPWLLAQRPDLSFRLVVINNGGGKIFSRVFGKADYENQHQLHFADWAKMWKLSYQVWTEIPAQPEFAPHQVIEILPDEMQTTQFWQAYDESWAH